MFHSEQTDGAALEEAGRKKEQADVARSGRCRFLTAGIETGWRWASALVSFVKRGARAKARSAQPLLQKAAQHWWRLRWSSMISIAAQVAFAVSLTPEVPRDAPCFDGAEPALAILAE